MSVEKVVGERGHKGAVGGHGQRGGVAIARNEAADDIGEIAIAVGGQGGRGGDPADSSGSHDAGTGGRGGRARAITENHGNAPAITADATATGGDGGSRGAGSGDGGRGGVASGRAVAVNASTDINATADATATVTGGAGGTGSGSGHAGGDGGVAMPTKAVATVGGNGDATAIATKTGGMGGAGLQGADGGNGADSAMFNAARAFTAGGIAIQESHAIGGAGGTSSGGQAGSGGDAHNGFAADDRTSATVSDSFFGTIEAQGGAGGTADHNGKGGGGGSAAVDMTVAGEYAVFNGNAYGGDAGASDAGGAVGGDARVSLAGNVSSVTNQAVLPSGIQGVATGGRGGDATVAGNGGVGGQTLDSTVSVIGAGPIVGASVTVQGGSGGAGRGVGFSGADGQVAGTAHAYAENTRTSGLGGQASASVNSIGGNGGDGLNGADGGNGAEAELSNVAAAKTATGGGALDQSARGGDGGNTVGGGDAGAGGNARSLHNVDADTLYSGTVGTNGDAIGGDGGAASGDGAHAGEAGTGYASTFLRGHGDLRSTGAVVGGKGGDASSGAHATHGGDATNLVDMVSGGQIITLARADGGLGGGSDHSGKAGDGGNATLELDVSAATSARSLVNVTGGAGGDAIGSNAVAGNGGGVDHVGVHVFATDGASAAIFAEGGNGGNGTGGAAAGQGASLDLANAVTAQSNGGTAVLSQEVQGGMGGSSDAVAGDGGSAHSTLTYDDTGAALKNTAITFYNRADGSAGGNHLGGGDGTGGHGGDAVSISDFVMSSGSTLQGDVTTLAGRGGDGTTIGASGNATSTVRAAAQNVDLDVTAGVLDVNGLSGLAQSTIVAQGAAGHLNADASVYAQTDNALDRVTGSISTSLEGTANLTVSGRAGGDLPTIDSHGGSSLAFETTLDNGDLTAIYKGNDAIETAFNDDPEALVNGFFDSVGSGGSQTIESSMELTIQTTELKATGDLVVGLYGGDAIGSGFDTLHFEIAIEHEGGGGIAASNGVTAQADGDKVLVSKDFTSEAEAEAFFSDHAINLGDLSDYADDNGSVQVVARLTVVADGSGGGYEAGILIGDVGGDAPVDASRFAVGQASHPQGAVMPEWVHAMMADPPVDIHYNPLTTFG